MTHLIGSEWVEGTGEGFTSVSPSDGTVIWQGNAASPSDVAAAIAAAREAFATWSMMSLDERLVIIKRYAELLADQKEAFANLIAKEAGKVLWDALGETTAMINKIAISITAYEERTGSRVSENGPMRTRLSHRPHGVMAVFGPYNFPGHLPNGHIVPALIAGNTVVFKPSELTPAVAEKMARIWQEAGLPAGVFNLVQGSRETGVALAASDQIDGLLFTGSVTTGKALSKQMADRPEVIMALEMGGNNPLIVHEVGDLRAAAIMTINSAFISTGQRCTCARRLIVPKGVEGDAFIAELMAAMKGITIGAVGDEPEAYMGPMISAQAAKQVLAAQEALIAKGATPLVKATLLKRGDAFISPALLDVTAVTERPDEEVFGPLLQVIRVPDFTAAIAEANHTRFGLAAGLISDNKALYEQFYPRMRAGIVNWNQQLTGAASTAPFGGPGLSGNHRPSAYYAADYCAFPVASIENLDDKATVATLPIGLKY